MAETVKCMIIRHATVPDLSLLTDLYEEFFLEAGIPAEPSSIRANLAQLIDDPRAIVLVLEEAGSLRGFSAGSLTFGVEFGWSAEFEDLFVSPSCRGRGWARKLAATVIDWATGKGADEMVLVITPEAQAKQELTRFYGRLGFRDSNRIVIYRSTSRS